MIRRLLFALVALALLVAGLARSARADFAFTVGSGATAFSFTSTTGGTSLCAAASTHCFASVPINKAGAQLFAAANPGVVGLGVVTTTLTGWTSATAADATQSLMSSGGSPALIVQLVQTSTISAGAVTFEGTFDGTNWVTIPVAQVLNPNTFANLTNAYTLVASTNQPFLILTQGYQSVRIRLSTQITGSATVTPFVTLLNYNPTIGALLNATAISVGGVAVSSSAPFPVNATSQYPVGATAITASATGTTGATTATLAGTSGKTTYICGYSIRANATAAATVTNTITGVITATLSSVMWVAPLASGLGIDEQIFSPCIPASATNTGIAIVSGAPGSGGAVSSKGWGYQL